jgi:hypothetical protein
VSGFSGEVVLSFMIMGPSGTTSSVTFDNFQLDGNQTANVSNCSNHPPVVFAGGPYLVNEGGLVHVTATAADPDGDPLHFDWDLDNDGSFESSGAAADFAVSHRDGPGELPITVRACDLDAACTTSPTRITIVNVGPTATFAAPSPITAGEHGVLKLVNPLDFSSADTSAGFRYSFACDGRDTSLATSYATASPVATRDCTFTAAGQSTVKGRIFDKDQGQSTYEAIVTVLAPPNQPPTAEAFGPYDVNEGGSAVLQAAGSDPDGNPLTYRWDLNGDGVFETSGATPTFFATFSDGPSTRTVALSVCDDKSACTFDSALVRINNVAPTGLFAAPGLLMEGGAALLALSNASDPGVADTQAGLRYAFACDGLDSSLPVVYASAGPSSLASCPFSQNGTYTVKGRIIDKDGAFSTYSAVVVVGNQAPTATFMASGPVPEGGGSTLAFVGAFDPGSLDVAAGFHYGFACDGLASSLPASYAGAGLASSTSCVFADDGSYPVKARIFDQDGGATTYDAVVVVTNVAPTAILGASGTVTEGGTAELALTSAADPGTRDLAAGLHYGFACDGLESSLPATYAIAGPGNTGSCPFPQSGSFTVKARVYDKDGGATTYETIIVVNNEAPTAAFGATTPIREGSSAQLALSNASDASPLDREAGLRYGFACDGLDSSLPTTYASAGLASVTSCTFTQNGTFPVKGRLFDQDGGFTTYDAVVVVTNVAPAAIFTASGPLVEGESSQLALASPSDPGSEDTAAGFHYAFACDGLETSLPTSYASAGAASTASCAFPQSGTYTVKARIIDQDGGLATYELAVFVANQAPVAAFLTTGPIPEGSSAQLALVGATDASALDAAAGFRYGFACDGQQASLPASYEAASTSSSTGCFFAQNGLYPVLGRIFDRDGGATTYDALVLVNNVAPIATIGVAGPITEGGSGQVTLTGPIDPGLFDQLAGFHYGFACDGLDTSLPTSYVTGSTSSAASCTFPQSGSYTIKARIIDQDGGENTYAVVVQVLNQAPLAVFTASSPLPEGSSSQLALTGATDVSPLDTAAGFRYGFACDGLAASLPASYATASATSTASCLFRDNGTYLVKGRVFDQDEGYTDYQASVVVTNVAPTVGAISAPADPRPISSSITSSAAFTDPGVLDTHTAVWQWGDGTSSAGVVTESQGAGTVAGSHSYATPGLYVIKLVVTDKDGGVGQASYQFVIVYDPGHHVTAGGSIDWPGAGPCGSGKGGCGTRTVQFEFHAMYHKVATFPQGQAKVDLTADGLAFRGDSQDWLVVTGATLKLKGLGTFNGNGGYAYLITGTDSKIVGKGGVDGFRVKIWQAASGKVVYDNLPGLTDDSAVTEPITRGSITIHK